MNSHICMRGGIGVCSSVTMSVVPALRHIQTSASSMNSEPASVKRKNLTAAIIRRSPPQTPMMRIHRQQHAPQRRCRTARNRAREHAHRHRLQQQERDHELAHAARDRPAGKDRDRRENSVSRIRNRLMPSTPMRIADAEPGEPGHGFHELKSGIGRVERPTATGPAPAPQAGPERGQARVASNRRLVAAQRDEVDTPTSGRKVMSERIGKPPGSCLTAPNRKRLRKPSRPISITKA